MTIDGKPVCNGIVIVFSLRLIMQWEPLVLSSLKQILARLETACQPDKSLGSLVMTTEP
ncbi:MAG: hypothetical protein NZ921_02125 [Candidatus Caldarchaeum sp.]|nr:hypothetical protein [Candidatus Caldarchaeum sp.]